MSQILGKDKDGALLSIGDTILINRLEAIVEGFTTLAGEPMVITNYGNFALAIVVKKVKP